MNFFNNEQQTNLMIIIASALGIFFGAKWSYEEISVVITLWQSDMDIMWFTYTLFILFYFIVFLVSVILFFTFITEFKFKELFSKEEFKALLIATILFDLLILTLILLNEYFLHITNRTVVGLIIVTLLLLTYFFKLKNKNINIFFFFFALMIFSALILFLIDSCLKICFINLV